MIMDMNLVADPQEITKECPHEADYMRKTLPRENIPTTGYAIQDDGTWVIYSFDAVRQILRSNVVKQAGFQAEKVMETGGGLLNNPPILYLDGEEHHRQRRETNRFFTPRATDRDYREFMNDYADKIIADFKQMGRADLSEMSMDLAVQVAARIVGLTDSWFAWGLESRLDAMINTGNQMLNTNNPILSAITGQVSTFNFLLWDVMPAIRQRRKNPQDDVISYLLERDYSTMEIMTECVVYGVAGMATTREFISVALWHLLENPHLAERMRVGSQDERYAILHEILRLEPVVGHLYRRATEDLAIELDGKTVTIPAGTKMNLHIAAANTDSDVMGDDAEALCPMRDLADRKPKVMDFGLSFGDGAHRCPGAYVAIQESDIFLQKLLQIDGLRIEREPDMSYFDIAEGYEIRNFIVTID